MRKNKSRNLAFSALILFAVAVAVAAPFIGSSHVSLSDVTGIFNGGPMTGAERIFWEVRVPRILLSLIAGATLALCGMSFQAIFRNPLATPFTLGVSGGAAFGAVLAIKLGLTYAVPGVSMTQIFAFAGALASIFLVYGIAKSKKGFTMATMLLTGVAMSFFFSALIMFVQFFADYAHSFSMVRWMMGSLAIVGYKPVIQAGALSAAGATVIFLRRSDMNLLTTGDEIARGRGVDVDKSRTAIFIAVSLATGGVVAICGPIGFVGLMIPHIMRLIFGADHFDLAPACIIGGAAFLALCDTFARTIISPFEIPIGVITAMLGGPFFIWLLFRHPN